MSFYNREGFVGGGTTAQLCPKWSLDSPMNSHPSFGHLVRWGETRGNARLPPVQLRSQMSTPAELIRGVRSAGKRAREHRRAIEASSARRFPQLCLHR